MKQIVIEIEDEIYNELKKDEDFLINFAKNPYKTMILKGTVLYEHGRLIDGDYLYKKFEANGCKDSNVYRLIKDEPTILEATKENI